MTPEELIIAVKIKNIYKARFVNSIYNARRNKKI